MRIITQENYWWSLPIILGLLTPIITQWSVKVFLGGIPVFSALIESLPSQFDMSGALISILLALTPFIALIVLGLLLKTRVSAYHFKVIFVMGLIGILIPMIQGHYSVWAPLYQPNVHASSTGVLLFLVLPFFCILTMLIGAFVGWLVPWVYDRQKT